MKKKTRNKDGNNFLWTTKPLDFEIYFGFIYRFYVMMLWFVDDSLLILFL